MQDPQSGAAERLTEAEFAKLMQDEMKHRDEVAEGVRQRMVKKHPTKAVGPARDFVTFAEGERVVVKGAHFEIVHLRPGRMSLKPVPR